MKAKPFLPLFLRTAARFLLLWCLMVLLLSLRELDAQTTRLENGVSEAQDWNLMNAQLVLEGDYDPAIKPAQYDDRMGAYYSTYAAVGVFRLYDVEGLEMGRSQLTSGSFALPNTGTYDHYLNFDAVLTDDEQLALGRLLRESKQLNRFYGTESGLHDEYLGSDEGNSFTVGLRGEITGVVEHNVVYPQKVVYHYEDGPVTLLDTDSPFFDGKTLTTFSSDCIQISSVLAWAETGPELTLRLFREAEARLEGLVGNRVFGPSDQWASSTVGGSGYARSGSVAPYDGLVSAIGVSYRPGRMATHGLWFLYLATLLFTLLLAFFTARAQARSLQRERDLTNAVAHELKTPLAILHSYAEGLREDIAPEKREEYLDVIMDQSGQMAALVSALLDLSRMKAGKTAFTPGPVSLDQVTAAVFRTLERPMETAGVTARLDLPPCTVSGEEGRLSLVVSNLAANALRHTPPGGEIRAALQHRGAFVRLTVENDGDPIPEEALPRLFEPFYRSDAARDRQSGGTGLGLALVRETAALHGGACGVENLPTGVRFWVEIPLCKP